MWHSGRRPPQLSDVFCHLRTAPGGNKEGGCGDDAEETEFRSDLEVPKMG